MQPADYRPCNCNHTFTKQGTQLVVHEHNVMWLVVIVYWLHEVYVELSAGKWAVTTSLSLSRRPLDIFRDRVLRSVHELGILILEGPTQAMHGAQVLCVVPTRANSAERQRRSMSGSLTRE